RPLSTHCGHSRGSRAIAGSRDWPRWGSEGARMGSAPPLDVIVPESGRILGTLNWLRAGVLGANDGVVSTAAIIFGVAGGSASHATIMLAAVAAIAAGALSMAAGEYVSVSTQRDIEEAELAREKRDLEEDPER